MCVCDGVCVCVCDGVCAAAAGAAVVRDSNLEPQEFRESLRVLRGVDSYVYVRVISHRGSIKRCICP